MNFQVGDRVMVVWGCCAKNRRKYFGTCFTIAALKKADSWCPPCGVIEPNCAVALTGEKTRTGHPIGLPVSWLIKMPPDEELKEFSFSGKEIPELLIPLVTVYGVRDDGTTGP